MIATFNIKKLNFCFVFRHKWDIENKKLRMLGDFRDYRIGVWFKKSRIVGSNDFKTPSEWKNNLVNSYIIGINLLVCKAWISVDCGGKHIDVSL